jgi:hypothetical protein
MNILLTILAIVIAPVLTLILSIKWNNRQEAKKRKIDIFRTLMATRAIGLSPVHVEALNRIDVEFYGKKSKDVVETWKIYHDHLNDPKYSNLDTDKEVLKQWADKKEDLFVNLLYEMAIFLGYKFSKVDIKRGHYYPRGFGDIEEDQVVIRKGLVRLFKNEASFPIHAVVIEPPPIREIPQVGLPKIEKLDKKDS